MSPVVQLVHCTECKRPVDPNGTCTCGNPHGQARRKAAGYSTSLWSRLRRAAIERDGCCVKCGSTEQLTGGHLRYPALTVADVQTECASCNKADGSTRSAGGFR